MAYCFSYHAIDCRNREIRVLELLPGRENQPVRATFSIFSLNNGHSPRFEALSYMWGNRNDQVDIELNGMTFAVSGRLRQIFRDLRLPNESRLIWIDAV